MVFQCINNRQVPWEVLKTATFGLGFQQIPRDLANVNTWKTMFDPYNVLWHLTDTTAMLKLTSSELISNEVLFDVNSFGKGASFGV